MNTPNPIPLKCLLVTALVFSSGPTIQAQQKPLPQPTSTTPHRTRLILKDGSYQIIMSYRVVGNVVHYISAERGGAEEEIPAALVDFDATRRWDQQHATPDEATPTEAPPIDPELLKEEADRAALTPEVAKDLRLPEEDSTLILDTFRGTPELVPLAQTDSDLNRNTGHNILRAAINPLSFAEFQGFGWGDLHPVTSWKELCSGFDHVFLEASAAQEVDAEAGYVTGSGADVCADDDVAAVG